MANPSELVQKLWDYCNFLRDDGLSFGDYTEQLTVLRLPKMTDQQAKPPFNDRRLFPRITPAQACCQRTLTSLSRVIALLSTTANLVQIDSRNEPDPTDAARLLLDHDLRGNPLLQEIHMRDDTNGFIFLPQRFQRRDRQVQRV